MKKKTPKKVIPVKEKKTQGTRARNQQKCEECVPLRLLMELSNLSGAGDEEDDLIEVFDRFDIEDLKEVLVWKDPFPTTFIPDNFQNPILVEEIAAKGTGGKYYGERALLDVMQLAVDAKKGGEGEMWYLHEIADFCIASLNEIADNECAGKSVLHTMVEEMGDFPQLIESHKKPFKLPSAFKDASDRMQRLGVGRGIRINLKRKPGSTVVGNYAGLIIGLIVVARSIPVNEPDVPLWAKRAHDLSPDRSTWVKFAVEAFREMKNGQYAPEFLRLGDGRAEGYLNEKYGKDGKKSICPMVMAFRNRTLPKNIEKTALNQQMHGAFAALEDALKARL